MTTLASHEAPRTTTTSTDPAPTALSIHSHQSAQLKLDQLYILVRYHSYSNPRDSANLLPHPILNASGQGVVWGICHESADVGCTRAHGLHRVTAIEQLSRARDLVRVEPVRADSPEAEAWARARGFALEPASEGRWIAVELKG